MANMKDGKARPNYLYPLQTWLLSLAVIAPILMFIEFVFIPSRLIDDLAVPFVFIPFALALSLPTFLVYYLSFLFLTRQLGSSIRVKMVLNAICIAGILITFSLIGGSEIINLFILYSTSVLVSSFIFKVFKMN